MAKPDDASRYAQKKAEPIKDQVQEQEEEGGQKDSGETEHQRNQNLLGNEALQNQMIANNPGDAGGGGGGGGGGMSVRKSAQDKDGVDYGGDGDADDLPLTLEDLVRSWNPGTNKTEDRASWLEPMPDDELPPEDPEFLERVKAETYERFDVKGGFTVSSRLQPSAAVVASSVLDWTRGVRAWIDHTPLHRALAHATIPPAPFLQDIEGRLLLSRARAAAVNSWLLLDAPALRGDPRTGDVAFVGFCLELLGHRRHLESVKIDPGVEGKQMPATGTVFQRAFDQDGRNVDSRELSGGAGAHMLAVLRQLIDLEDPAVYLPVLVPEAPPEEDDPLGLDAILAELTGGPKDLEAPLYYAAMQAAEKLAAATARTRIHFAATAVVIAQCGRLWLDGPPVKSLLRACGQVDGETDRNLRLLVEIARAAQRRSVPPKGLSAGLKRASRALSVVHKMSVNLLSGIAAGVLPGNEDLEEQAPYAPTPLDEAWADGAPHHALPWLRTLPDTPETRATIALTASSARLPDVDAADTLIAESKDIENPLLRAAVRVCAGPILLRHGRSDDALALSGVLTDSALAHRNGMALANAVLLGVEAHRTAGRADEAERLRETGAQTAFHMGAPGALTLLARYTLENEEGVQAGW